MAVLFDSGVFSVMTTANALGVGWKLYFYQSGTTTARATYPTKTDAENLTNPNANPIVADASGRFGPIWVVDALYKLVLKDASGVVKVTRDPCIATVPESAASAAAAASSAAAAEASAAEAAANPGAKTANTATLISAIRNNGFFPQPSWRTAANDIATITVPGGSSLVSSFGGTNLAPETAVGKLNWVSGPAYATVNGDRAGRGAYVLGASSNRSTNYLAYEFINTSNKFEAVVKCGGAPMQAGVNFRVLVGGKVSATATLPTNGDNKCVLCEFPTSATRTIRIEVWGGGSYGIYATSAGAVSQTGKTYPLISVISDSFGEATGGDPWEGEAVNAVRAIGGSINLAAVGGTGLLAINGKTNWQDAERLKDLALNGVTDTITAATPVPNLGIVTLSLNDDDAASTLWGGAANYKDAFKKAMWAQIDHWQTNCPGKPLVYFGPTWPNETPSLDMYAMDIAAREVCAGQANVWYISKLEPGPRLRKGAQSKTSTTGTLAIGTKVITGLGSTTGVIEHSRIAGTGIPSEARVMSVDSASQVTIDIDVTANGSQSLIFYNDQAAMLTTDADTTHPNPDGHSLDGNWMAEKLRELILTQFA